MSLSDQCPVPTERSLGTLGAGSERGRRRYRDSDAEGMTAKGNGEENPLPSRLGSPGERRKLPQRGPGQSTGEYECCKI